MDALGGDALQALRDCVVEGRRHAHVETAPDKCQAQRFAGQFCELYANSTHDARAWLKDDAARL